MKLSVNQQVLAKGLSIVGRAVSSRTTMPVLSNILLEAKNNQLRLAATNREFAINCWIGAKVEDEGAITIPARLLSEFVNSLPPERIDMELTVRTQTMRLSCAKNNANIKGIDAFEFPLIPTYQPESTAAEVPAVTGDEYTVAADALTTMINGVAFAASQDENRPTLTGIETTFENGRLTLGATDGYRMSMRSVAVECTGKNTVIIPSRNLSEVARICAGATSDIGIIISGGRNQILFSATDDKEWTRVDVVSELIEARFPDYRATIPKNYSTRAIMDTALLQKAVRVALLFARDNSNIVRVSVVPESNLVRLSATSGEMGDNVSELDAGVEGGAIEIAFNAKYMLDALGAIETAQVALELTQPTRPGAIKPVGDSDALMLLMPMAPPK